MRIDTLIDDLNNDETLNDTLELLEEIIVERNSALFNKINEVITSPERIHDTRKFASLLVDLQDDDYITSLISMIKVGIPGTTKWLSDYMYSLGSILDDLESYYEADDQFVELMGTWLLNTNGGEISWKAGIILSNLENEKVHDFLILGIKDENLFHLTRGRCLRRLVNEYGIKELSLFKSLINEEDQGFSQLVKDAIDWLYKKELEQ